jgi:hypothetical protein
MEAQSSPLNTYTSGIGNCIHALPKHVQRLVGNIPTLDMPMGWDTTDPKDLIVETDGSVLFGVGYHSWVIAKSEEEILLTGGGPDDGDPLIMKSCRSELGGLAAGLAVIGTLERSDIINIRSVKCVCNKKSAILTSNRQPSDSIFHKTETDYDVISTIHELQYMWCNKLEIKYSWLKDHADKFERELDKYERLNIMADEICDQIRVAATGSTGARGSCGMWYSETCALFIRGVSITSHVEERLTRQLLNGDVQTYLMEKENWSRRVFDSINWRSYGTAFKRLPRSRQTAMAKACHSLWHTGEKHKQYYGGQKPCCMRGDAHEDWRHDIITFKSLDASLHRTVSWTKVKKSMTAWRIPPDFWIAKEKGINQYAIHPLKRDKENMPPEPQKYFGTTCYTPRNIHQVAFWKQSHVVWENFFKGRICIEWCTYIKHHLTSRNIKKDYQEWATQLILALWEHIHRVWMFRNTEHHEDNQGRVARYKEEAISRRMDNIWPKKDGLRDQLHEFQLTHFNDRDKITNLWY